VQRPDPDPFALRQISGFRQMSVMDPQDEQEALRRELGLTVPQVAAIKICMRSSPPARLKA
jgi:hypothetical protein